MRMLFVLLFCFFQTSLSFAGSQASAFDLDPIIVSLNRTGLAFSESSLSLSVLGYEDIQAFKTGNLGEVLAGQTGISIASSGSFGQASSVSMRGADPRQVKVMVDGIPFNTQLSGQANLSVIPLESVDRIEVIRGGNSSVWGSGLGGVINVITASPPGSGTHKIEFASSYGQFAQTKNSLTISAGKKPLGIMSSGSFYHADGDLAQSRSQEVKNHTKISFAANDSVKVTASYGYSGAHLTYGPTSGSIYKQPYVARYGQIRGVLDKMDDYWEAAYKYNDQRLSTGFYDSSSLTDLFTVRNKDLYQGASVVNRRDLYGDHVLTAGLDLDHHTIKSDTYLDRGRSINSEAVFANDSWDLADWTLQPALRFDNNGHYGSQLSPAFGAVYHLPEFKDASIRFRASRVFNAPPLLYQYNNSSALMVAPNPHLKAERANSYEMGVSVKPAAALKVSVEGYYSDVKDGIAVVFDGSNYQSRNFKKFRRKGGQFRLDYQWHRSGMIYSSVELNDVVNVQTKEIVRDSGVSRDAFKWGGRFKFDSGLGINWEGRYARSLASPGQAYDRKPLFDLKLTQDIDNFIRDTDLQIFFLLHNVTNSKFWLDPSFPDPGRYMEGGFSLTF